ncbi:hypothetical protein PUN28_001914 [Cardiocondyla obscurior]|uniref:Uncharacterized protein n=1 Tax=Cardiocondyla obscurior TaxID=286306 RepID=A0AAW2GRV3_9HYME
MKFTRAINFIFIRYDKRNIFINCVDASLRNKRRYNDSRHMQRRRMRGSRVDITRKSDSVISTYYSGNKNTETCQPSGRAGILSFTKNKRGRIVPVCVYEVAGHRVQQYATIWPRLIRDLRTLLSHPAEVDGAVLPPLVSPGTRPKPRLNTLVILKEKKRTK